MATNIDWPFAHPWLREGYGFTPADMTRRMATPSGTAVLQVGTTGPDVFNAGLSFTRPEFEQFKAWLRYTLKNGSLWFNAPVDAGTVETREVRLTPGSLQYQSVGYCEWRVSAQFETRVGTEISAEEYAEAQAVGGVPDFITLNNLLDQLVNQSYPAAAQEYS